MALSILLAAGILAFGLPTVAAASGDCDVFDPSCVVAGPGYTCAKGTTACFCLTTSQYQCEDTPSGSHTCMFAVSADGSNWQGFNCVH
jgi:hypothetical protein